MTIPLPLAERFQALADPSRLRMLALLREMELSVGELAQVLAQSQPRVVRHLKILADARVLERRKEGSWVFLQLGEPALVDALVGLSDWIADPVTDPPFTADRARLAAMRSGPGRGGRPLFRRHAHDWDEIRSLHVAESRSRRRSAAVGGRPSVGCSISGPAPAG